MEKCSLFVRLDGECTYYDYFSNIEQCLIDAGFNLKKDKDGLGHVAVMLTLASAMIGARLVPEYNKYIEMIKFVQNFKDAEGLDDLIEMFDGSYVSSGVMLLHNECITPDEFDIYEKVVNHFYLRCMSEVSKVKFRTINANYIAAKNEMIKYFDLKEKAKEEEKTKANKKAEKENDKAHALDSPRKLAEYLKQFVIGQDLAVDIFANTALQYYRYTIVDKKPPKPYNVLIIGASGPGKTTLMNAFDTISNVYMVDCTGLTESGYKGTDAKDIVKNSKYGNIVFYDEFDKLLVPSIDGSGRDAHKEVQGCFYKMMEKSHCLNIFAGAFEGIDEIVKKRLKSKKTVMGFSTESIDYDDIDIYDVTEEDLIAFGATREFTGRIDVIVRMRNLEEEDFVRILKESECSPVKSEIAVAKDCYGIELELMDDFYSELAAKASSQAVGARSLKQHINRVIDPILAQGMDINCSKVIVGSLDSEPQFITKKNEKREGDIRMSDKNQFMNIPEMPGESLPFLNNKENEFVENEGTLDVYKHGAFISCVKFGNYTMQTAVMPSDLKVWVELEWYIIDIKDDEALLIADKCIAWDFYCGDNTLFEPACPCSWEKSYVREYLNDKFYSEAFTEKEKELIISRNEYNDKIFLLDLDEIEKLFAFEDLRRGETYFVDDFHGRIEVNLEPTWWWINTVGSEPNRMCVMSPNGDIYTDGRYTDADETGIRPAMWVNVKKLLELKGGVSKTIYALDSTLNNR